MTAFVRARRPEHKQQRREAILDAARELAVERGVRAVTLGSLADRVGLAKSNVVRYFGTREEIFVELCTHESVVLGDALVEALRDAQPADVARVFAKTVLRHGLFCELLSHLTTHLEHNVSFAAAEELKVTTHQVSASMVPTLVRAVPGLNPEDAARFLGAAIVLVGGMWAGSRPSEVVRQVYAAHPDLLAGRRPLEDEVEALLAALLRGLTSRP